jgi:predicted unusual protein kinase regulating ubiquinone biosynthesis (AarF/ABC1/UbiB family)
MNAIPNDNSENLSHSANERPTRFRFLLAFGVTFRIVISLGFFHLLGKFFGAEWENSQRPAGYGKNAQRLKGVLLSLQGIFIKAGQLISITVARWPALVLRASCRDVLAQSGALT